MEPIKLTYLNTHVFCEHSDSDLRMEGGQVLLLLIASIMSGGCTCSVTGENKTADKMKEILMFRKHNFNV